ncbi:hypothetical protein DAPPUDRAFT_303761 [Daphnia pulex]|uniref:RGS domain-containing protein n=1 Tax=Daphnia pulex TaxID=6669 RepID=E9GHX9_DAPPU|nr:hypothetical protein DAPPUDRAFT_303761 [Daphnia pulex]|eukprot:EFX80970.1 hypothetical protein DAPPUDRAFT_303761 [Daphnia pulex]
MAFWKRLGKRSSVPSNNTRGISNKNYLPQNNNDSASSSMSLSTSGDLGESLYNNLQRFPSEEGVVNVNNTSKVPDKFSGDFGDLGDLNLPETIRSWSRRSRLSKNLQEVLMDLTALSYFQQYLESKHVSSYLMLLNDLKNYHLLATSLSTSGCASNSNANSPIVNGDGLLAKWSPSKNNDTKVLRLLNSTSSSSGFSDDTSLDSPGHSVSTGSTRSTKPLETDTMAHSLLSERRRIIQKYFESDSSDYLPTVSCFLRDVDPCSLEITELDADVFQDVQIGVCNLLENDYFIEFLHSEFYYRYQLEIITGGKLSITDIIYNDACLFYFMEYMDQEGKRHWLEFLLAADNYRSQWNSPNASSDALIIYNKYFSLQATQPLGLVDAIRSNIEENICMTKNGPGPDCFENALHVLLSTMEKKYLQSFMSSPVFCQYLNDIVSALKNTSNLLSRCKRSGSTSTINSEVSGISCSTTSATVSSYLAAGGSSASAIGVISSTVVNNAENSMIRLGNSISNESLMIDIRQLNDPDALWQRKKITLSLGRLTPFGRFYSEIEFPVEKKTESKITKAVRKFVFVEEDQEKEDMAWQMAEIIIKDVLAITSGKRPLQSL